MSVLFSPDEQDTVGELMNLGVGRAAGAFSRLVNDEVLLSVPDVSFVALSEAQAVFEQSVPDILAGVKQSFSGFIGGAAALLFPEDRSLELVRAVIGEDLPAEEISELEQETLAEIGNIILNNCLATMANVLQDEIETSLPETYAGGNRGFLAFLCDQKEEVLTQDDGALLMLVQIDFSLKLRAIQGFLAFAIDLRSAESFHRSVASYLARLGA